MIEVQILIAAILAGMLFVLVRISWTLKGILDALSAERSIGTVSNAPHVPAGNISAEKATQDLESTHPETYSAHDELQDIAAVVAVADRTIRQGTSKPTIS